MPIKNAPPMLHDRIHQQTTIALHDCTVHLSIIHMPPAHNFTVSPTLQPSLGRRLNHRLQLEYPNRIDAKSCVSPSSEVCAIHTRENHVYFPCTHEIQRSNPVKQILLFGIMSPFCFPPKIDSTRSHPVNPTPNATRLLCKQNRSEEKTYSPLFVHV
jgi:hypothetical protein